LCRTYVPAPILMPFAISVNLAEGVLNGLGSKAAAQQKRSQPASPDVRRQTLVAGEQLPCHLLAMGLLLLIREELVQLAPGQLQVDALLAQLLFQPPPAAGTSR